MASEKYLRALHQFTSPMLILDPGDTFVKELSVVSWWAWSKNNVHPHKVLTIASRALSMLS